MEYKSAKGGKYSFNGWGPGESPVECFDRKDWLACMHGVLLALNLSGSHQDVREALGDEGAVHELLHLAAGVDIATRNTMRSLRKGVENIQRTLETYLRIYNRLQED